MLVKVYDLQVSVNEDNDIEYCIRNDTVLIPYKWSKTRERWISCIGSKVSAFRVNVSHSAVRLIPKDIIPHAPVTLSDAEMTELVTRFTGRTKEEP